MSLGWLQKIVFFLIESVRGKICLDVFVSVVVVAVDNDNHEPESRQEYANQQVLTKYIVSVSISCTLTKNKLVLRQWVGFVIIAGLDRAVVAHNRLIDWFFRSSSALHEIKNF